MAGLPQTQISSNPPSQTGAGDGEGAPVADEVIAPVEAAEADVGRAPEVETDDRRDSIAQRFREKRAREEAEARATAGQKEAEAAAPDDVAAAGEADLGVAEPEPEPEPVEVAPPVEKKITIYIDGKPVEKTEAEVIAMASKSGERDNSLAEARRLLDEVKSLKPGAAPAEAAPEAATPAEKKAAYDPERSKRQAEGLQVGDLEAGAAALQEMKDEIRDVVVAELGSKKGLDEGEVERRVEAKLKEIRAADAVNQAVTSFREKHPAIVNEPLVRDVAITLARDEMLKDWAAMGATEEQLAPFRNGKPETVALMHQQMVTDGYAKARPYNQILETVGETISKKFNLGPRKEGGQSPAPTTKSVASQSAPPAPARIVVDPAEAARRVERKQAALPQPKTAGGRGQIAQQQRPKTRSEIVAEMRTQRGHANNR